MEPMVYVKTYQVYIYQFLLTIFGTTPVLTMVPRNTISNNIQNSQKNKEVHRQDPMQQSTWVSNAAGAMATRFVTSLLE